jgi:hypothetical protein
MLYGIDCASHQGNMDYRQLAAEGHSFLICKVNGEGNYVNPYWRSQHDGARAAGMIPGTYDWVEPQGAGSMTGAQAAEDYLRTVGERGFGSLLTVDFESPEWYTGPLGRNIEPWMRDYLYTLRTKSGKEVIIYTAPYFLRETGAQRWDWLGRDFLYWMAAPGNATGSHNMLPDTVAWPGTIVGPWDTVLIHQHQWFAESTAVRQHFDRNRYQGTKAELAQLTLTRDLQKGAAQVREPEAGKYTAYINTQGEPIFVWNMGGKTPQILGIDVKDLGMTVASATEPDKQVSASIQNQVVGLYHESERTT